MRPAIPVLSPEVAVHEGVAAPADRRSWSRRLRRPVLAAAALALALTLAPARSDAGPTDSPKLQGVTYHVGTRSERRDVVRRSSDAHVLAAARALGRAGFAPDGARDAHERPTAGKIFGADDREPVYDTEAFPWSAVAKVYAHFPDGAAFEGSAVLVGRDQALTAGHVVYDPRHGGWADDVVVVPGFDLGYEPFGEYVAQELRSFAGFVDDRDYDYDIALLGLDARAGDLTGWLGIAVRDDAETFDALLNTAGYPADLDDGEGMWYAADYPYAVDAHAIRLNGTLDAAQGQSGSGVWLREGDARFVVGVVSTETSSANVAARITGDVFDVLDAWLDGFDGPADLAPTAVTTTLPFDSAAGQTGTVSFEVDNFGARPAVFDVDVLLDAGVGARPVIGSARASVAAGDYDAFEVPVAIPSGVGAGTYRVTVRVNGDGAVPESDYANNEARGPQVSVAAAGSRWQPVELPTVIRDRLSPNGEGRWSFTVSEPREKLVLRLAGAAFTGFAIVVRPDGTTFTLLPRRAYRTIELQPQLGEWRVLVKNRPDAPRPRRFRLKVFSPR